MGDLARFTKLITPLKSALLKKGLIAVKEHYENFMKLRKLWICIHVTVRG